MILPSSKEEDKLLKKRYAVFNDDGSLAELKGFEVKRRGELQLIKIFQSQIFEKFLLGTTTQECYAAVAQVADQWLDVLYSRAESLSDEELIELIAENRSMSKTLAEYAGQKSTSISTARRLAEFLGDQMVKDKGLACKFIISAKPMGAPVTERAVPVAIFSAEENIKQLYLRRWLKDNGLVNLDLRSILDWEYYIERLGSVVQKLITIPAAMQKVTNPVPRIAHPDWLHRRILKTTEKFKQNKMTDFFGKKDMTEGQTQEGQEETQNSKVMDIEDTNVEGAAPKKFRIAVVRRKPTRQQTPVEEDLEDEPIPNPAHHYPSFVKAMRSRWRKQRELRMGGVGAKAGSVSNGPSINVPSMFKSIKVRTRNCWDIVQIRPDSTPGRFILWLLIDSDLVSIPIRIPRMFYIHMKVPREDMFLKAQQQGGYQYQYERVTRNLPHGLPCVNLYKITVREDVYHETREHFVDLMNDPNVDGVYEQQVSVLYIS